MLLWLNRRILAAGFQNEPLQHSLHWAIRFKKLIVFVKKKVSFPCKHCAQESCCLEAGCSCGCGPSNTWQARQSNHIQLTLRFGPIKIAGVLLGRHVKKTIQKPKKAESRRDTSVHQPICFNYVLNTAFLFFLPFYGHALSN